LIFFFPAVEGSSAASPSASTFTACGLDRALLFNVRGQRAGVRTSLLQWQATNVFGCISSKPPRFGG
jgi:hypothetical protein